MSHFATFYSYKGGVGRTLALANVAWLLANHHSEPARVLAMDFDLGAPGLSHVLGMRKTQETAGLVDYVTEYLHSAAIPDISAFIHKTSYDRIDLIPAGCMDSDYQRRLESINWKDLYDEAFGYELIEKLKSDISAITPEYDYVLIDSLTGYSDVGGICVSQLPDSLILLFRLNQQNLEGIERVYRQATLMRPENIRKSVIPVVTPSWPFIDRAATVWIRKAQRIFQESTLLEISFDSSLSFGETIISQEASKFPFTSKILTDYQKLAAELREKNPLDCWTIWTKISERPHMMVADDAELHLSLLKRRPYVGKYWERFPFAFRDWGYRKPGTSAESIEKLRAFVDEEAAKGNKFALLARARTNVGGDDPKQAQAINDLERAIQIDPSFVDALIDRGQLAIERYKYEDAARDFSKCLDVLSDNSGLQRWRVQLLLAKAYLQMFDGGKALSAVGSPADVNATDPERYRITSKALYLEGDYQKALTDARRLAKFEIGEPDLLLPSQILSAMGRVDEARKELESLASDNKLQSSGNTAEAYLAVDPQKTVSILTDDKKTNPGVRTLLIYLARLFLGEQDAKTPVLQPIKPGTWSLFEVVALLRAKERAGTLAVQTIQLAYEALRAVGCHGAPGSRPSFGR